MPFAGLACGEDPYLIHVFFRPQEWQLFLQWPAFDPEDPEGTGTGVIWSNRDGWNDEVSQLSGEAEPMIAAIVALLKEQSRSIHRPNDYPSLCWSCDDQLIIAVHPLDRCQVWEALRLVLMRAGYPATRLTPDPMGVRD